MVFETISEKLKIILNNQENLISLFYPNKKVISMENTCLLKKKLTENK